MKNKVALVFCGQGRSVYESYESIKEKIIDKYKPDIYCHLWWDDDIKKKGYNGYNRNYQVDENTPEIIKKLYSPKNFLIEEEIKNFSPITKNQIDCPNLQTFFSQFISIQRACGLFDWSEYDFILKWRYDLEVFNFPNLNLLDKTKFYTGYDNKSLHYDDLDFFSDLGYILPNDMRQFTQIVDNILYFRINNDCVPEHVLFQTLKLLNLREKMIRLTSDEFYCDVIRILK